MFLYNTSPVTKPAFPCNSARERGKTWGLGRKVSLPHVILTSALQGCVLFLSLQGIQSTQKLGHKLFPSLSRKRWDDIASPSLLLSRGNGDFVLLQKSNYECVKIYCDSMPACISQISFSGAEAYGLPKAKEPLRLEIGGIMKFNHSHPMSQKQISL